MMLYVYAPRINTMTATMLATSRTFFLASPLLLRLTDEAESPQCIAGDKWRMADRAFCTALTANRQVATFFMRAIAIAKLAGLILACVGWACFTGCVTNEAGRNQLMLVSAEQEMQMGLTAFDQMKKEVPISKDPQADELVQRVGKRIASVVSLPNAQWEFVVFESKEANAFCLPGGKIGVYTGILPITKDEAGLATVLGHEVAHATLHHGAERVSRAMLRQGVGEGVGAGLSAAGADPRVASASEVIYGTGSQLLEALPHSRAQESEADHRGLIYMALAGYDPEMAVAFWQRFSVFAIEKGGGNTLWFLRTHPLDETRIKQLQQWVPEAKAQQRSPR